MRETRINVEREIDRFKVMGGTKVTQEDMVSVYSTIESLMDYIENLEDELGNLRRNVSFR